MSKPPPTAVAKEVSEPRLKRTAQVGFVVGQRPGNAGNRILRLFGEAKQGVREWRNRRGQGNLWAKQKGMLACTCAIERAISSVELGDRSEKGQKLVLAGECPAIEIRVERGVRQEKGRKAYRASELPLSNRGAEIGVTAEEFDLVLRLGGRGDTQDDCDGSEKLEEQQLRET